MLDADEQALAPAARRAPALDDEPWTLAELVLVDEAEALLNGVGRTYGHVVVDEAQDLSRHGAAGRGPALPVAGR